MSENMKKTQSIFVDNIEYDLDSLNDEQKTLIQHCVDLDRKINSASFNLDQLRIGKEAFVNLLKQKLFEVEKAEVEVVNDN